MFCDVGKEDSRVGAGDWILLENKTRKSGLDHKYDGPFTVMERRGPNVLVREDKRGKIKNKWVHLNRCKAFAPPPATLHRSAFQTDHDMSESDSVTTETNISHGDDTELSDQDAADDLDSDTEECSNQASEFPRKSGRMRRLPKKLSEAGWP